MLEKYSHWTKRPDADEIKARILASRAKNPNRPWLGKKRDPETIKKLHTGRDRWRTENPEAYEASRKIATQHMKGKTNPNWKDGKYSGPYSNRLGNAQWKKTKEQALSRDKYRCTECGNRNNLIVHHIVYFNLTQDDSLDNLTTLCRSCHIKIHPPLTVYYE